MKLGIANVFYGVIGYGIKVGDKDSLHVNEFSMIASLPFK